MSLRFFTAWDASLLSRTRCAAASAARLRWRTFGANPGTPLQQVSLAKLIIVWETCHGLQPAPDAADQRASATAKLVVIDPRRVKVAEQAHLHLPVRPGTDVVLAWAIAVELEDWRPRSRLHR